MQFFNFWVIENTYVWSDNGGLGERKQVIVWAKSYSMKSRSRKTPSNVTVLHMTDIKRVAKIMIVQEIYNEFYNYVGRY